MHALAPARGAARSDDARARRARTHDARPRAADAAGEGPLGGEVRRARARACRAGARVCARTRMDRRRGRPAGGGGRAFRARLVVVPRRAGEPRAGGLDLAAGGGAHPPPVAPAHPAALPHVALSATLAIPRVPPSDIPAPLADACFSHFVYGLRGMLQRRLMQ